MNLLLSDEGKQYTQRGRAEETNASRPGRILHISKLIVSCWLPLHLLLV